MFSVASSWPVICVGTVPAIMTLLNTDTNDSQALHLNWHKTISHLIVVLGSLLSWDHRCRVMTASSRNVSSVVFSILWLVSSTNLKKSSTIRIP